tara:strand:- start:3745 stop:4719 length:975 start_codon:yes stop_codon:yes gene_type:complete
MAGFFLFMRILFPDIHRQLTNSMARSFVKLGYEVLIPGYVAKNRPPKPVKDFVWHEIWTQQEANKYFDVPVKIASKEQILDLKPEIVFITAFENQSEILYEIMPNMPDSTKLAHYSGNDYWPGAYPLDTLKNYVCADYMGFKIAFKNNINHIYYKPPVDYDIFKNTGPSDNPVIGSYIVDYKGNFPEDFLTYNEIRNRIKGIRFDLHERSSIENVAKAMQNSIASLHIKRLEGYGMSIIQSMACGRPVFLPRRYAESKSYKFWALEGETALFFDSIEEMGEKLHLIGNKDYREKIQETCAKKIREIINNEEQEQDLKRFLENLQ